MFRTSWFTELVDCHKIQRMFRESCNSQASLLSQLKHINIVSYRQSFQYGGALCIVMQYCEGGDLHSWLAARKGKLLEESQVIVWFVQISLALQYLHGKNILHRDLKTQNIFLTHKNEIVKVGDLGIARVLTNSYDMASTVIGTPYYMSPELFSNRPYSYKSDVWSLGCVVYEMCTMKHAFKARDFSGLALKICRGQVPPLPSQFSSELSSLVSIMLAQKAEDRPSVSEILHQRFIRAYIQIFIKRNRQQSKSDERKHKKTSNHKQSFSEPKALQPFESKRSIKPSEPITSEAYKKASEILRQGSIEKSEETNHSPHIRQQRQLNRNRVSESEKVSSKRLSNSHHLALIPSVIDLLKKDDSPAYIKCEEPSFIRGEPRRSSSKENEKDNADHKNRQISSARKRRIEDKRNSFRSIDRSSPSSDLFSSQSSSSGSPSPTLDFYPVNIPSRCTQEDKPPSVPNSPTTFRKNNSITPPPRKLSSPTPVRRSPTPPPRRNSSPTHQKKQSSPITHRKTNSPGVQRKVCNVVTPRPFRVARPLPPTPPSDDRGSSSKQHGEEEYTKLVDLMNNTLVTQDKKDLASSSPAQHESLSRLKDRLESLRNQVLPRVSREILEKAYRVLDDSDPDKVQIKLMLLLGQGINPELMNQVIDMYVCEHRMKEQLDTTVPAELVRLSTL